MLEYDVAIIGSGPSSVSAYESLMKNAPRARVCIVEAGGANEAYLGSSAIESSADFRLSPTTYLGKGGTSELWHSVLAPLDPIDFEDRSYIGSPAWPIGLDDLKPYYEAALKLLGVADGRIFEDPQNPFSLNGLDLEGLTENFEPKLFIQLKKHWRAKDYWKMIDVRFFYFHFVEALRINGGLIEIISTDSSGALNPYIYARKVIIAAGGLNSPQIVYNSEISSAAHFHVGRRLLDHPMGVGMQLKRHKPYNFEILASKKEKELNKKVAFRVKENIQKEEGIPNSTFYFRPSFKEGYSQHTEELKAKIILYKDYLLRSKVPWRMTLDLLSEWNLVRQVISYKTGLLSKVALFDIFCVTEQVSSAGRIVFEKSDNGFYKGKCIWGIDEIDEDFNLLALNKIVGWAESKKEAGLITVFPKEVSWFARATSAAHHIGTLPMAESSVDGVVDSNCAIFGMNDNVFVADASVMPSAGCANVTLTSMALAMRVGEYVAHSL